MPSVRFVPRRVAAVAAAIVAVALLSGCSVDSVVVGLDRIAERGRDLVFGGGSEPTKPSTDDGQASAPEGVEPSPAPGDEGTAETGDAARAGRLEVSIAGLRIGDCIGETDVDRGVAELLPCDGPHIEEVYHEYRILESDYPGDDEIVRLAEEQCRGAFEAYVGEPWETSTLGYLYWAPGAEGWDWGDRVILCTLYEAGNELQAGVAEHAA